MARAARETVRKAVIALYDRRVKAGLCKYDARDRGKPPHEAPTKNIRRTDQLPQMCPACYDEQLARKRRSRA